MAFTMDSTRVGRQGVAVVLAVVAGILASRGPEAADAPKDLRIGASGGFAGGMSPAKEKAAMTSLRGFIKEETGQENTILQQKDWQDLAKKLASKELHVGVFQGYEFAWAQEKHADLKPLALAVNVHRNQSAYVLTNKDNKAKDFAGLAGQSFSIPVPSQFLPRVYVDQQCQANGKKMDTFFSKITKPDNVEDALDDVVDGVVNATVVERTALEAFKRRKPGRFKQLIEVAHSEEVLPPVIGYHEGGLDKATLDRFRDGLIAANKKERGRTLLTLFRLTGFEAVPEDFDKVAGVTRKAFPVLKGE